MAKQIKTTTGFTPFKGMIGIKFPKECYPTTKVLMTKEGRLGSILEKAKEFINGELEVANIGEGVTFVQPGDKILIQSRVSPQHVEMDKAADENSNFYWIIRESEILLKID